MPVIGTPIPNVSSPGTAVGIDQLQVGPTTTLVEGQPVLAKMKSVTVTQSQLATIQWTMLTPLGDVVDLTTLVGYGVTLCIKESTWTGSSDSSAVIPGSFTSGTVVNPALGQVQATLTAAIVQNPGVFYAEFGITSPVDGSLVFSNTFFLFIEPSQFGALQSGTGPLTIAEIRLYLRDVDPVGNLWLASFEWDVAEIAACILRPIREFNEAPPPLTVQFNTKTFPYRDNWTRGAAGYMLRLAADWYRRVHLPYQAGNLSIDDKNKFQIYDERGKELIEEWRKWMTWKKIELNCNAAYQSAGSDYNLLGWW